MLQRVDEVARLLRAAVQPSTASARNERDGRETAEVGDHRGEVGAAVGEELRQGLRKRSSHSASIVGIMDAVAALADLTEISSQVETAVLVDGDGAVLASTVDDAGRSERLARTAVDLLAARPALAASSRRCASSRWRCPGSSVFVASEGGRSILATTAPAPTSGLVLYDLRACLRARSAAEAEGEADARTQAEADADA